jgi:uncharacterized protein (TIGR00255 family)
MTGFARRIAEAPSGTLTCEIRAVNHRYLDVQFRLPEELRPREVLLRKQVGGLIARGKIDCTLHFRRAAAAGRGLTLNRELVQQLAERAAELGKILPQTRPPDVLDVLRWPGVVEEPEIDTEPLYEAARAVVGATLADLNAMRASEGGRIGDMLEARSSEILAIAATVRERMPEVLAATRERQRERLANLDVSADPSRLEIELALVSQKLDVDEELDRLESHISEIRQVVTAKEAVGRRLDFLMQELNREANTLGSKSADTVTTRAAVDLKVLVEQMREQIQNVE